MEQSVLEQCDNEVKVRSKITTMIFAARGDKESQPSEVIDVTRFSNWTKLLRVTALVRKFIAVLKNPIIDRSIVAEDIQQAERLWVMDLQTNLKENKHYLDSLNENLGLFEEDSLIRCAGSFKRSVLPYSSKYPTLLLRNHHVTELIILHCHSVVAHNGTNETLAELRQNYWVQQGRQMVRTLLHNCRICKWFKGRGYKIPRPAD